MTGSQDAQIPVVAGEQVRDEHMVMSKISSITQILARLDAAISEYQGKKDEGTMTGSQDAQIPVVATEQVVDEHMVMSKISSNIQSLSRLDDAVSEYQGKKDAGILVAATKLTKGEPEEEPESIASGQRVRFDLSANTFHEIPSRDQNLSDLQTVSDAQNLSRLAGEVLRGGPALKTVWPQTLHEIPSLDQNLSDLAGEVLRGGLAPKMVLPQTIWVCVQKVESERLGLSMNTSDANAPHVTYISAAGIVAAWNAAHSEAQIHIGDRIVTVNGTVGNARVLLEECSLSQVITMEVLKKAPVNVRQEVACEVFESPFGEYD